MSQRDRQIVARFALRLREAMLDKRMSLTVLAAAVWRVNIDRRDSAGSHGRELLALYFQGVARPERTIIEKLAAALEVPADELDPDRAAVEIRSPDFVFINSDKGGLIVMPAKFARAVR